jgi:hypothetical protein
MTAVADGKQQPGQERSSRERRRGDVTNLTGAVGSLERGWSGAGANGGKKSEQEHNSSSERAGG